MEGDDTSTTSYPLGQKILIILRRIKAINQCGPKTCVMETYSKVVQG